MQFYDLLKELIGYIPSEFGGVRQAFTLMLPAILVVCALFTAFFGLKCAVLWCSVTLFFLGTTVSAEYLLPRTDLSDFRYWMMLAVCLIIGMLLGVFSKYPARIQLIASMFTLAYASLPSFITFFGDTFAKVISFIVALALAFLTIKYKYIIIIATTSFSGSFIFWNVLGEEFSLRYTTLYAVLTGLTALAFQTYMNYDKLKETYEDVKMKYRKTEQGSKKAYSAVKRQLHLQRLPNVKVILWDFDNTLMDFSAAERNSLRNAFRQFGLGECTDETAASFAVINAAYWRKYEAGEQTMREIMVGRFRALFEQYGIEGVSPAAFCDVFENGIADTVAYMENSKELVASLRGKFRQYIVTNGARDIQRRRIRESGFGALTDGAFISDELQYEKPHREFFDVVFRHLGDSVKKEEILIVGDSLTSDMQGGNNAGILCCWYNPKGKKRPAQLRIDCEIRSLSELLGILPLTEEHAEK